MPALDRHLDGVRRLLGHGADPNAASAWARYADALHHALAPGNAPALSLALDLGLPPSEDALPTAVWRERTDAVRVLLARGAPVTPDVRSLAERAQTEVSEWTPHRSREIADLLDGGA